MKKKNKTKVSKGKNSHTSTAYGELANVKISPGGGKKKEEVACRDIKIIEDIMMKKKKPGVGNALAIVIKPNKMKTKKPKIKKPIIKRMASDKGEGTIEDFMRKRNSKKN